MRRRNATWLAAVALGAIGLIACGDSGPATFEEDGFPFTFEYPDGFEVSDDPTFSQNLGGESDETVAVAVNDDNGIVLQKFTLRAEVDQTNLSVAKDEIDGLIAGVDADAQGGEAGETAGFPSLEYGLVKLTTPEDGESRILFLFEGDQEYVLNCQSTPDEREEIAAACDRMLETVAPAD